MAIYKDFLEINKPSHFQVNKWVLKNLSDISVGSVLEYRNP